MRRQREQSADLCWQLDPDFEAAKVQFSRCLYSIQVFAEQQKEIDNMFQRLIDMTEVRGLWVRLVGLADARAEAHKNSGALLEELAAKEQAAWRQRKKQRKSPSMGWNLDTMKLV